MTNNPDLKCGDPGTQWEWHEAYRDIHKNMYRTSYSDMIHGRETNTKSDYPAGYGGHIPGMRFDVLHKNTEFHRTYHLRRTDPGRDGQPSYGEQIAGIPTITRCPRGARKAPSYKTVPNDSSTLQVKAPYGQTQPLQRPPCHRDAPASLRSTSLPALRNGRPSSGRPCRPSSSQSSLPGRVEDRLAAAALANLAAREKDCAVRRPGVRPNSGGPRNAADSMIRRPGISSRPDSGASSSDRGAGPRKVFVKTPYADMQGLLQPHDGNLDGAEWTEPFQKSQHTGPREAWTLEDPTCDFDAHDIVLGGG